MSFDEPRAGSQRTFPVLSVIVALVFIGLGLGYAWWAEPTTKGEPTEASTALTEGALYYLFVETAEFAPTRADGEGWDLDDSAPDLAYRIDWKGQGVFESSEVGDALIARWSGMKIGAQEALNLLKVGKADPAQIIDAALIRADPGEHIALTFIDRDITGEDEVERLSLPIMTLNVGTNRLRGEGQRPGLITATLRVVPGEGDLFQIVRALSSGAP